MSELNAAERRALKVRAHDLQPVVAIGNAGVTPAVLLEIGRSLAAHELIKIKVAGAAPAARLALLAEICARTGASPVQTIGKILVIHLARPAEAPVVAQRVVAQRSARPSMRRAAPQQARARGNGRR